LIIIVTLGSAHVSEFPNKEDNVFKNTLFVLSKVKSKNFFGVLKHAVLQPSNVMRIIRIAELTNIYTAFEYYLICSLFCELWKILNF